MSHLIEVPVENGNTVFVEVEEISSGQGGVRRRASPSDLTVKTTQTFEDALDRIKPAATAVISKLRELPVQPEQITVEFGIKLSADAKVYIASASAEANFKVSITWKRQKEEEK